MFTWIKVAARNLLRNRRRSIFTVLAIGAGFAAVNVFGGFTEYIFGSLEETDIYAMGNGHLMIFKNGFLTKGKLNPTAYLLSEVEVARVKEVLRTFPQVEIVTPQLYISGLLSNGNVSTPFVARGYVPSDVLAIRGHGKGWIAKLDLFTGKSLADDIPYGVGVSYGLAKELELHLGSDAIAIAATVTGQMNALDVRVSQLFDAAQDALTDMGMVVPIKFAQSLYDTKSVDRLAVLLSRSENVEAFRDAVVRALGSHQLDVEVKTWKDLDPLYRKSKDMFDIIFRFIFVIVLLIVVMSVVNTMSMAVVERTREIGTLRALGVKRSGIVKLFALESGFLGAFGCLLGMILTLTSWWLVNFVIRPTWIPPLVTRRVPLEIYLVPEYMAYSGLFLMVLSVITASFPARKAAHQEVVDALGHV